jgi:dihydrofolate reductase
VDDIAIVFVVAVADNGVIGRDGGLPWRLKSDMAHFRRLTIGKPVVMGRKTFLSLNKPLKDRTNIVVTRDKSFSAAGAVVAHDLDAALTIARDDARRRGTDSVMVIGGADIYTQTLPLADRIELTLVHLEPPGDTLFPALDQRHWREVARSEHPAGPDDDAPFALLTFARVTPEKTLKKAPQSAA